MAFAFELAVGMAFVLVEDMASGLASAFALVGGMASAVAFVSSFALVFHILAEYQLECNLLDT
jgi:uncharacterized membrane protein